MTVEWQFQNPHDKQISKQSLIFEFDEEFIEIFKIKDKCQFKNRNSKDHDHPLVTHSCTLVFIF